MDKNIALLIVGMSTYEGTGRNGKPYSCTTLECEYEGEKAKIRYYDSDAKIGDYAEIGFGIKRSVYGPELAAVVQRIIPADEMKQEGGEAE